MTIKRVHGRCVDRMRPVTAVYDQFGYGDASVIISVGNTKVQCVVTRTAGVPNFLKGKKRGWLTAEYAMLPSATKTRTQRELSSVKRNGRSVEISRMIGRSLRSVVDLSVLADQTIMIDCDVLQADGGTRTACITGASLALARAQQQWLAAGSITGPFIRTHIAAVSVGLLGDTIVLDPDCAEDQMLDADFNFVLTESGAVVEIQGTGEKNPVPWPLFQEMHALVYRHGIQTIFEALSYPGCSFEAGDSVLIERSDTGARVTTN